ncbi:hypothetical protein [Brasilonema sp. UFV-L1]|uniref:hypothetical protein n=1 Tax=Brasilonema sp. UFV-L1 TaxID=2234130 RepID=UPI00145DE33B|nr:hypothetical protein [Brasilonema sp. UFV-L1]
MMEIDSSYYNVWFEEFVESFVNEKNLLYEAYKIASKSFSEYGRGAVLYDVSLIFHQWLRSELIKGEKTEISVAYGLSSNSKEWLQEYKTPLEKTILNALNQYDPDKEFLLCVTSQMNAEHQKTLPKALSFKVVQITDCKSSP